MKPSNTPTCPHRATSAPGVAASSSRTLGDWPPGPRAGLTGWRLLGRLSRDPLGTLAEWQRNHGDIVHARMLPEHMIVLTEPRLARELLVDHHDDLIRSERGMAVFSQLHGHSVFVAEGADWRAKRQALQPAFSPKAVQTHIASIVNSAAGAMSSWRADCEEMLIESALTSLSMDIIMRLMFSSHIDVDARAAEQAVHVTSVAINAELYWPASWPDWMPWKRKKRRALRVLHDLIDRHLRARLAERASAWPEDLLSRLLSMHREDPRSWPLNAVRDECMTAFLAGHETSAAALTWWVWCMAAHPQAQADASQEVDAVLQQRMPTAQDLSKLPGLVRTLQEALRLYPAVPVLLTRRSLRPITVDGWTLPERTLFSIPVRQMHHDPRWFPEPEAFRPERFSSDAAEIPRGAFMPFGAGPRVCIGQNLALAEMTAVAAMILQRFKLTVPNNAKLPVPVLNVSLRPEQPLLIKLSERRP